MNGLMMNGLMDRWMNMGRLSFDCFINLAWSGLLFFFSTHNFSESFLKDFSERKKYFFYIFLQWYMGKAYVNISVEVENAHFSFEKITSSYRHTLALSIDLNGTSQALKLLVLCHQWPNLWNVTSYLCSDF